MGNIVTREKKDLFIEDPYVIEGPDGHASTGKWLVAPDMRTFRLRPCSSLDRAPSNMLHCSTLQS